MEFVSDKKRTFEDFKSQIPQSSKPIFEDIRKFCLSLGDNIVEDVRMHRVVFGKSMSFRWFTDIEPENDGVLIKIQKDRKEPPKILQISSEDEVNKAKELIKEAYEKIH